jgi:uncharacterized protein (TIGR02246 family)
MKQILPLALMLIAASSTLAQTTGPGQLENFVDRYEETWQLHDAERLATFFAEDADMIMGIEPRIVGRAAIEAWWSQYFSRIDSRRILSISIESIRLLSPDIAVLNVATTTSGIHSTTNESLEPRKARGTWVVVRTDGDWKISALRAHSPVGEPREAPGTDNQAAARRSSPFASRRGFPDASARVTGSGNGSL